MKLIVGLGNPGAEYAGTRHNAGFMVLERLARRHGLSSPRTKFHAALLEWNADTDKVLLMQPTTYMNRSGRAVGEAANFYKLPPSQVLVVVDETALPVGRIRLRPGGGDGGHNGLADIHRALGTGEYPRLRVGVGAPVVGEQSIPKRDYVLSRFTDEQKVDLEPALDRAADAAETWARQGIDAAMNRYNQPEPEPE
jgi:PTH1 family peptidyl-tRNA hydrolase